MIRPLIVEVELSMTPDDFLEKNKLHVKCISYYMYSVQMSRYLKVFHFGESICLRWIFVWYYLGIFGEHRSMLVVRMFLLPYVIKLLFRFRVLSYR